MDKTECDAFVAMMEAQGSLVLRTTDFMVFLDRKQYYLGRCFVWASRHDCKSFFDMTENEWHQLRRVTAMMEAAYRATFRPDIINVAFLGNEAQHLHAHLVPRYKTPPQFEGMDWRDEAWGKNYSQQCARGPAAGGRKIDFTGPADRWLFNKIRDTLVQALAQDGATQSSLRILCSDDTDQSSAKKKRKTEKQDDEPPSC